MRELFETLGAERGLAELERRLRETGDFRAAWELDDARAYVPSERLAEALARVLVSCEHPNATVLAAVLETLADLQRVDRLTAWMRTRWPALTPMERRSLVGAFHECRLWPQLVPLWEWLAGQEMDVTTRHRFCAALATTLKRHPSREVGAVLATAVEPLRRRQQEAGDTALRHFLDGVAGLLASHGGR